MFGILVSRKFLGLKEWRLMVMNGCGGEKIGALGVINVGWQGGARFPRWLKGRELTGTTVAESTIFCSGKRRLAIVTKGGWPHSDHKNKNSIRRPVSFNVRRKHQCCCSKNTGTMSTSASPVRM